MKNERDITYYGVMTTRKWHTHAHAQIGLYSVFFRHREITEGRKWFFTLLEKLKMRIPQERRYEVEWRCRFGNSEYGDYITVVEPRLTNALLREATEILYDQAGDAMQGNSHRFKIPRV